MSDVMIVYWSGTGNTEKIAGFIEDGVTSGGAGVTCKRVSEISPEDVDAYRVVVFGSPSMGAEVIEESEMEPFFAQSLPLLKDKTVALFGSYGWGDGEWMRTWVERLKDAGIKLLDEEGLPIQETSIDDQKDECIDYGKKIAQAAKA